MSEAWGFQRSVCLKSYYGQKWEIRFTLGLSDAKNTLYIKKKGSNKSCSEMNFVQKSSPAHTSISLTSGARGTKDQYV